MKRILAFLLLTATAKAVMLPLFWDASGTPLVNYAVWTKKVGEVTWTWNYSTDQTFFLIDGIEPGMWEVKVTAFVAAGVHSEPSNVFSVTVPDNILPPSNLRPKVAIQTTETPDIESSWVTYAIHPIDGVALRQFIRPVFER